MEVVLDTFFAIDEAPESFRFAALLDDVPSLSDKRVLDLRPKKSLNKQQISLEHF